WPIRVITHRRITDRLKGSRMIDVMELLRAHAQRSVSLQRRVQAVVGLPYVGSADRREPLPHQSLARANRLTALSVSYSKDVCVPNPLRRSCLSRVIQFSPSVVIE